MYVIFETRFLDSEREVRKLKSSLEDKCREYDKLRTKLIAHELCESLKRQYEKERDAVFKSCPKMGYSMKNEAIDTAKRGFDLYSDDSDRANYIRNRFETKFGTSWHCIVGKTLGYSLRYTNGEFI